MSKIQIRIKKQKDVYIFAHNNIKICSVQDNYLSPKGKEMIENANEDDLSSASFFDKLADEQYGHFKHINAVYNYLIDGGVRYTIYYDGFRNIKMADKFNHLVPEDIPNLTKNELVELLHSGKLAKPVKDIKIRRLSKIIGFTHVPTYEEVLSKFPEIKIN